MSVLAARPKGLDAAVHRYGSVRSFVLRTLYSWLTLTILLTFSWPMLVVYAGAPGSSPGTTPADWFIVRLVVATAIALVVSWLWRVSPAPAGAARPERAAALLRRGRVWPQVVVFLAGLCLLLAALLLAGDPARGLKVVSLGLAETLALQALLTGWMFGTFEIVLENERAYPATLALFALTFGIRGGLASSTQDDLGQQLFVVAVGAGAVVGLLAGGLSLLLRARSGSLLPGILAHLMLLYILPALFEN